LNNIDHYCFSSTGAPYYIFFLRFPKVPRLTTLIFSSTGLKVSRFFSAYYFFFYWSYALRTEICSTVS
jgi:hypothetical protein